MTRRPTVSCGVLVAFALCLVVLSLEAVAGAVSQQTLTRRMQQFLNETQIPGVAVVLVQKGRPDYTRGFGLRSVESSLPVDEHTVFKMNSVTKSMTAAALAVLVDQGKLTWRDRIIDGLPEFRLRDPWVTREVTFEDVLSHRVGVEANDWLEDVPGVTLDEAIHRLRFLPQAESFRATFLYDNFMYSVAGVAGGRITGDWDRMVRGNLLEPLGMTDSITDFRPYVRADAIAPCHECELDTRPAGLGALSQPINIAAPHLHAAGRTQLSHWRFSSSRPAGAVWSSAHDMAKYLKLYLNRGTLDGRRVLSEKVLQELTTPRIPSRLPGAGNTRPGAEKAVRSAEQWSGAYALGWSVGAYRGHRFITHGGGSIEYQSRVLLFPDDGAAIALMANLNDGREGAVDALAWEIADELLGLPAIRWINGAIDAWQTASLQPPPTVCGRDFSIEEREPGSDRLSHYVGRYEHPAYGVLTITQQDARTLLLSHGPNRSGVLRAVGASCFELRWNGVRPGPEALTFVSGADGAVAALQLRGQFFTR